MATLISMEEGVAEVQPDEHLGVPYDFIDVEPGHEVVELENIINAAWSRVEARICCRYTRRPATFVLRTERYKELIELPLMPLVISTAEIFDPETGNYSEGSFINGPTNNGLYLPTIGTWRITGTAGASPALDVHPHVLHAWKMIVAWMYENRGDVEGDFALNGYMIGSGAADLLKPFMRVA